MPIIISYTLVLSYQTHSAMHMLNKTVQSPQLYSSLLRCEMCQKLANVGIIHFQCILQEESRALKFMALTDEKKMYIFLLKVRGAGMFCENTVVLLCFKSTSAL